MRQHEGKGAIPAALALAVFCAFAFFCAKIVTVAYQTEQLKATTDHAYTLYDLEPTAYSNSVRCALVIAPNERAARMQVAIYEHDSKWECKEKTSCVPSVVSPTKMILERHP